MRILSILVLAIAAGSAGSLVTVALPLIASESNATAPELAEMLLSRFAMGVIVGMLVGAFAPRILGPTGALFLPALLAVTSILCGMAETISMLGNLRFAAGLFSGALTTYCFIVVALAYSRQLRAIFLGLMLTTTAAAAAFGPYLAARLVDAYGWRWTFYATAVICAIAMALVLASWQSWKSANLQFGDQDPTDSDWGRSRQSN